MTTGQVSLSDNHLNEAVLTIPDSWHPAPLYPGVRVASFDVDGQAGICVSDILSGLTSLARGERNPLGWRGGSGPEYNLRIYVSHKLLINLGNELISSLRHIVARQCAANRAVQ